jgi:hypothetical protein
MLVLVQVLVAVPVQEAVAERRHQKGMQQRWFDALHSAHHHRTKMQQQKLTVLQ